MTLGDERVVGPAHIARLDRRAVLEARLRPEVEGDRAVIGRVFDAFGDEPIGGQGLVERAGHQAVIERARADHRPGHPVRVGDPDGGRTQERAHVGIGVWSRCVVEVDEPNGRFACLPKG